MNTDYSNIVAATGDNLAAFPGSAFGGASIARVVMGGGGGAGRATRTVTLPTREKCLAVQAPALCWSAPAR